MPRAQTIDALRLLASLVLVVGHICGERLLGESLKDMLLSGVSSATFCLMSGFVVVSSSGFWQLPLHVTLLKRAFRLYPPHWFAFALTLPMAFLGRQHLDRSLIPETLAWWGTGMQAFLPLDHFYTYWNYPAWTITPLLLGGLLLPWIRLARLRNWPTSSIWSLLIILTLLRILFEVLQGPPQGADELFARHKAVLPRVLAVQIGGLAALLYQRSRPSVFSRDVTLITLLALTTLTVVIARRTGGIGLIYTITHGPYIPVGLLLITSAYANTGRIARLCSHPLIARGAEASILIWLLHVPMYAVMTRLAYKLGYPTHIIEGWPGAIATILATLITATLLAPLLRFTRYRASTAPPTPETPAPAST
jgi:peptidoglycan/LPS O-acetylase OafA/YrhL